MNPHLLWNENWRPRYEGSLYNTPEKWPKESKMKIKLTILMSGVPQKEVQKNDEEQSYLDYWGASIARREGGLDFILQQDVHGQV